MHYTTYFTLKKQVSIFVHHKRKVAHAMQTQDTNTLLKKNTDHIDEKETRTKNR